MTAPSRVSSLPIAEQSRRDQSRGFAQLALDYLGEAGLCYLVFDPICLRSGRCSNVENDGG